MNGAKMFQFKMFATFVEQELHPALCML